MVEFKNRDDLIKKVDKKFNEFIRTRDTTHDDTFKCISCGQIKDKSQMDAGHFWSRRHMSVRWDERNVNGQCKYCNDHLSGNGAGYAQGVVRKYGKGILDELEIKKLIPIKHVDFELVELYETYSNKTKELKKERKSKSIYI